MSLWMVVVLPLLMMITNAKEATEKDVFPFRAVWSSHTSSFWHRSSHMFDLFWKRAWLSKHTYTQCAYISYTICIINAHADIITLARKKSRVRILITFSNSLSRSRTSWIKEFGRRFHRNVQISAAPYHALNHARHNKNKAHTVPPIVEETQQGEEKKHYRILDYPLPLWYGDYPPYYSSQAVEQCDLRRDLLSLPAKRTFIRKKDTFIFATFHRLNEENWFPVKQPFLVKFLRKPTGSWKS